MSRTRRHKNKKYFHNGKLVDSQWMPQNKASKDFTKRGIQVPSIGGRAYSGHKPTSGTHRIYSGILRAKIKTETYEEINNQ